MTELVSLAASITRRRAQRPEATSRASEDALDLIANLLLPCLGRAKSRNVAMRLMEEYGTVSAALAAPVGRLMECRGVGEATAHHLAEILRAARYVAAERVDSEKPILSSFGALLDYCRLQMAFLPVEQFRVLFLNTKNRLIADEVQHTGTVDSVPVFPREIIRRALELSATALIMVHNHPSGDSTPSTSDLRITREVVAAASLMEIAVHDHIIVTRGEHMSMRSMDFL